MCNDIYRKSVSKLFVHLRVAYTRFHHSVDDALRNRLQTSALSDCELAPFEFGSVVHAIPSNRLSTFIPSLPIVVINC